MNKFKLFVISVIILALITAFVDQHKSQTALHQEILALRAGVEQLAAQVASMQQEHARALESPTPSASPPDQNKELLEFRTQLGELRERLAGLERANAGISSQIAAAKGPEIPFVYPDATKRKDYAFTGYATPHSAFQSMLWAITQSDAKTFRGSLTGEIAETFAPQFKDLPPDVMPGGFRNGAMFKASGYHIVEETPISDEELRLKVFLEGARISIKPVFKKVGGEWKWARNEF